MTTRETDIAFSRLYDENYRKVYRLALALAGNASDAEEITQEAFFAGVPRICLLSGR